MENKTMHIQTVTREQVKFVYFEKMDGGRRRIYNSKFRDLDAF